MSDPIRLWRVYCDGWNYTDDEEVSKIGEPIAALTRAEYDALVARTEKPLDHVMRTSCGHEWTVRHTACPRCFDALRAERDSLVKERDVAISHYETAIEMIHHSAGVRRDGLRGILAWIDEAKAHRARAAWPHSELERERNAATARAEKAERERDDARAALDAQIATVLAAHLDAPTDDDRRGEDEEAVRAQGGDCG